MITVLRMIYFCVVVCFVGKGLEWGGNIIYLCFFVLSLHLACSFSIVVLIACGQEIKCMRVKAPSGAAVCGDDQRRLVLEMVRYHAID